MTIPHLDDNVVDKINILWDNHPDRFLTRAEINLPDSEIQAVVQAFLTITSWDDALFMAEGVYERRSRSMDMSAFSYPLPNIKPTDPDYDVLVFEGVNFCDGGFDDYVNVSEPAFTRLMSRLFDVLVSGATQNKLPIIHEDWWGRFVQLAADIKQRAQQTT